MGQWKIIHSLGETVQFLLIELKLHFAYDLIFPFLDISPNTYVQKKACAWKLMKAFLVSSTLNKQLQYLFYQVGVDRAGDAGSGILNSHEERADNAHT